MGLDSLLGGTLPGKTGSKRMQSTLFHRMAVGLTSLMISGLATASDWAERSDHNLRPGVTAVAQEIHGLHNTVLWIVSIIGLLVFGLILISVIRHRRSKHPTPATFHENIFLEEYELCAGFYHWCISSFSFYTWGKQSRCYNYWSTFPRI